MAKNFMEDLQKKITPLLDKIPFLSKKNKDEDEDEYEDDDSKESETPKSNIVSSDDQTNPKFTKSTAKDEEEADNDAEDGEDEEDEEDEEVDEDTAGEKSQQKRKKIVQGLIILGVILFVGEEFLPKSEPEDVVIPEPTTKVKRERKKKAPVNEVVEEVKPVQEEVVAAPIEEVKPVQEEVVVVAPVEEVTPVQEEVVAAPVEEVLKLDEIENTVQETITEPEVKSEESTSFEMTENTPSETEQVPQTSDDSSLDSQLTNIIKSVEKENEQKKYEYTSPPNYENFGESLVYNCKGKHWACVDKQAHFQCLNNYRWAKQSGNKPECSNSKVLASGKDCRMLQLYNINMVAEIPDCN